jgi:hypothetical protein
MTESLTFTLRQAVSDDDVKLACRVRAEAYGRKVASYRDTMLTPDDVDLSPWTTIYLCEDKLTGEPVGTMRIQSTVDGGDLEIESTYVPIGSPAYGRAEISRLSAVFGRPFRAARALEGRLPPLHGYACTVACPRSAQARPATSV